MWTGSISPWSSKATDIAAKFVISPLTSSASNAGWVMQAIHLSLSEDPFFSHNPRSLRTVDITSSSVATAETLYRSRIVNNRSGGDDFGALASKIRIARQQYC
ncbi:hypothetical protein D9757_010784 [Collybiopsis confluens]|uniref:Uncharacterized protein n=1 Tax=Collybiopsis confluens TaxID=2823264 RepID=A0A8H5M2S6_9AGAR|nr:hypothetical protein D9757_010784 [Collybiopsis confluens]